ncbi:MAG TPA: hypothetical protein VNH46_12075 [Gemmatimonadales bacterium]|nr:hypothetical protein [Gemmatimonadales bacterium]
MLPLLTPDRRGIALPLAIFSMVIAGAMITAVFFVARLEQRHGNNSIASVQAFEAAETGAAAILANWNTSYNSSAIGSVTALPSVSVGGNASYSATVRRVSAAAFVIQSEGLVRDGSGAIVTRRELARLVRINQPAIDVHSAVTTRVGLSVSGSSQISGTDTIPPAWAGGSCPPPGPTAPGIRDSSGNVTTSGACSGASCITGNPPIQTDPNVSSGTFTQFGDLSFTDLAAMASKVVGGTITGIGPTTNAGPPVSCRTGDLLNWGDPLNATGPCYDYFPIIYSPGDLQLSGGWGQGILLVGGDLNVSGGVEFYGPVIVQGRVRSTGTGGHIIGGLMANNADFTVTLLTGNSVVSYSSCAVDRALRGSSRVKAMNERSWAQRY